ncbi:regulatory protein RecX [Ulvibacterium sp.]|uniref:regulatory protein RecX n=1 Tax=Ulvibacterium sp. TaxID=2665914 RepID=UPI003BAC1921
MPFKPSYILPEAIKKLERYCAYRERCHKEAVSKLKEMGMIPEAIDQIMAHLVLEGYLNEERFAKSFARGKFTIKKWGRNRITNELKQRNISKYNIQTALREIDEEDYQRTLDTLARKRVNQLTGKSLPEKRRKLADYLFYRGWENHLVYDKIEALLKEQHL